MSYAYGQQVAGVVQATARNGTGFKVNDTWFNVFPGEQLPQRGSSVIFVVGDDGQGNTMATGLTVTQQAQQGGYGGGQYRGGGGRGRSGGAPKQRDPVDIHGPIVGHNLLVAATLLGPGHSVDELTKLAYEITLASRKLVDYVIKQTATQQVAQPVQQGGYVQPTQPTNQGYAQAVPLQNQNHNMIAQQPMQQAAPVAQPTVDFDDDIPWG